MSKKDTLSKALGGFINSTPRQSESVQLDTHTVSPTPSVLNEGTGSSIESKSSIPTHKSSIESSKPESSQEKERATFILNKSVRKKLKYISAVEQVKQYDVAAEAFEAYFNEWEKSHGPIPVE